MKGREDFGHYPQKNTGREDFGQYPQHFSCVVCGESLEIGVRMHSCWPCNFLCPTCSYDMCPSCYPVWRAPTRRHRGGHQQKAAQAQKLKKEQEAAETKRQEKKHEEAAAAVAAEPLAEAAETAEDALFHDSLEQEDNLLDVIYDLVQEKGCIRKGKLFSRAHEVGISEQEVQLALRTWTQLGVMETRRDVVVLLKDIDD